MKTLLTVAFMIFSATTAGAGQVMGSVNKPLGDQAQQPRDAAQMKKGTAVIRGKVTAADSGRPLRRVRISVSGPELTEPRAITTNVDGVYEIKELPAGRYTVTATRTGYLMLRYGQTRPGEAGQPLQLADAQVATAINFVMPKMAVLAGRITDEAGDPLANVNVMPMRVRYFRGRKQLVPAGTSGILRTDDTGQFRAIGLEPGDYYVMATTRETWNEDEKTTMGFLITYFPGTPNQNEAQRVKVGLGQEVSGIDIALVPGKTVTVKGTAFRSDGTPISGDTVGITQEFAGPTGMSSFGYGGPRIEADGSFTIKNLLPGTYKFSVKAPPETGRPLEGATTTMTVTSDLDGLVLTTGQTGSIAGRIISDTGSMPPLGPAAPVGNPLRAPSAPGGSATRPRVSNTAIDPESTYNTFAEDNGRVKDDWTFEIREVMGAQRLSLSGLPSGWGVKAIEYNGQEVGDAGVQLKSLERANVTIVISDKMATLGGSLHDDKMQPAAGTVVVFPDDPAKWRENSRLVRTVRPDQTGVFDLRLIVPGEYLVAAVEYIADGDWNDPDVLKELSQRATRVVLPDGQSSRVDLTLRK